MLLCCVVKTSAITNYIVVVYKQIEPTCLCILYCPWICHHTEIICHCLVDTWSMHIITLVNIYIEPLLSKFKTTNILAVIWT